jgi:hypothetical protein
MGLELDGDLRRLTGTPTGAVGATNFAQSPQVLARRSPYLLSMRDPASAMRLASRPVVYWLMLAAPVYSMPFGITELGT